MKYFRIISSFLLKLFGEKRFVESVKVFPARIKPINPIQKDPQICESYACILKIFVFMLPFLINLLISFGICSTHIDFGIKISNIIILWEQSNPMSSNIRVLIKIYYIYPILYFSRTAFR